jgi:hypothetical protein
VYRWKLGHINLSVNGAVVRDKAIWLYNHYTVRGEKGSSHVSEGWFEKFKKTSLHNVKRTGESASADHMAGTSTHGTSSRQSRSRGYLPQTIFNDDGNRPEI